MEVNNYFGLVSTNVLHREYVSLYESRTAEWGASHSPCGSIFDDGGKVGAVLGEDQGATGGVGVDNKYSVNGTVKAHGRPCQQVSSNCGGQGQGIGASELHRAV